MWHLCPYSWFIMLNTPLPLRSSQGSHQHCSYAPTTRGSDKHRVTPEMVARENRRNGGGGGTNLSGWRIMIGSRGRSLGAMGMSLGVRVQALGENEFYRHSRHAGAETVPHQTIHRTCSTRSARNPTPTPRSPTKADSRRQSPLFELTSLPRRIH